MDRFETDLMEDLMHDVAESPAGGSSLDGYDEFEDGLDEWDESDEFGGSPAGAASAFNELDEYDEAVGHEDWDEGDEFEQGGGDEGIDAMEEAIVDTLDAVDGDEFLRRLRRIARGVAQGVRTAGRVAGNVARVVGPVASMLPIPQAQLIGRIANVAGRLLADGADEMEVFDDLVDGLDEDGIDAAAPVLAGILVRRAVPVVGRGPLPARRAAVQGVTRAIRQAVRSQGAPAARAVARAVQSTRRPIQARRLRPQAAARAVTRAASQVARQPQAIRRLSRPLVPADRRATPRGQTARNVARNIAPLARRIGASQPAGGAHRTTGACPHCGQARRLTFRGPVTLTIRGR